VITLNYRTFFLVFLYGVTVVVFALAAKQDWDDTEVSGELCIVIWTLVGLGWLVWNRGWLQFVLLLLLLILFYIPVDIPYFGDADILPIALYIAYYLYPLALYGENLIATLFFPVMLLLVMLPYAKLYYHLRGGKYKLFQGMFVPILPACAIAWWLAGLLTAAYYVALSLVFG